MGWFFFSLKEPKRDKKSLKEQYIRFTSCLRKPPTHGKTVTHGLLWFFAFIKSKNVLCLHRAHKGKEIKSIKSIFLLNSLVPFDHYQWFHASLITDLSNCHCSMRNSMSICRFSGNLLFLLLMDDVVAVSYFLMPHRPITEILCSIFKTEINTYCEKMA